MGIKVNKHKIGFLFLIVFLFFRVVNVHAFSHFLEEDESPHCELCEMMVTSQEKISILDMPEEEFIPRIAIFYNKELMPLGYEVPLYHIASPHYVYNKPPPSC